MTELFVTGTGTDVGKTVITRAIARAWASRGDKVVAIKPVESGVPTVDGTPQPADGLALAAAAGQGSYLCRYMFKDAISPHLAAQNEGVTIDPSALVQFVQMAKKGAERVLVEGAGGLLVPLGEQLIADLVVLLDMPLLIVAPNRLGCINATLLTIEAAQVRKIPVAGVVLNGDGGAELGNRVAIERYGKVPVLGMFPNCSQIDDDALAAAALAHLKFNLLAGSK